MKKQKKKIKLNINEKTRTSKENVYLKNGAICVDDTDSETRKVEKNNKVNQSDLQNKNQTNFLKSKHEKRSKFTEWKDTKFW